MFYKKIAVPAAVVALLIALAIPLTLSISQAQTKDDQGAPPKALPMMKGQGGIMCPMMGMMQGMKGQDGPGMMGNMMGQGMMGMMQGMMGQTAIAVDDDYLYILRGTNLTKVRKSDLSVVQSAQIPPSPRADGQQRSGGGDGDG